jgi:hypothetical protein
MWGWLAFGFAAGCGIFFFVGMGDFQERLEILLRPLVKPLQCLL